LAGKTLFEKVWEKHVVKSIQGGPDVLFIDKHLIHEVTSPQAFSGIESRGVPVFNTKRIVATADHNVPTTDQHLPIKEALSKHQVDTLYKNCENHNIELYGLQHPKQGIVHIIGPELGVTQPGLTMVCGDSHTSTHGAFGSIAFGIGTTQVEMVLATQSLLQERPKTLRIKIDGELGKGVVSKDIVLYVIAKLTAGGGTGYFIEFSGTAIEKLSMEARMTICNMSIEMGAKGGMIAPDQTTFDYMKGREYAPSGDSWDKAVTYWKTLYSDDDAVFDKEVNINANEIEPMITYGTNPGMGTGITKGVPTLAEVSDLVDELTYNKALKYMDFEGGQDLIGKTVNYVFIGSCTNARIEDLRLAAGVIKGRKKADNINAFIVPGSKQVEKMAIEEGIDKIFEEAGIQFRQPGCSACLAMNEDKIPEGEYCVSTSNRNFEGRQGQGSRTLLASPLTAAATLVTGVITDVRDLMN